MLSNENERKLPEKRKDIAELIGLEGEALKKMGELNELKQIFKEYNEGEITIYAVEIQVTALYINKISDDKDIQKGVGNLLEEIRRLQS